jgi:phage replication O-like protein O
MTNKKGFTQIPNWLLDAQFEYKLTLREIRALLQIIRFTYGALKRKSLFFNLSDLVVSGTYKSDARKPIESLAKKNIIYWDSERKIIKFNDAIQTWKVEKHKTFDQDKFDRILTKSLAKRKLRGSQYTNNKVSVLHTAKGEEVSGDNVSKPLKQRKERLNKVNIFNNSPSMKQLKDELLDKTRFPN